MDLRPVSINPIMITPVPLSPKHSLRDPLGRRAQAMACLQFYVCHGYRALLPNKRFGRCGTWWQRDMMLGLCLHQPPDCRRKLPVLETHFKSHCPAGSEASVISLMLVDGLMIFAVSTGGQNVLKSLCWKLCPSVHLVRCLESVCLQFAICKTKVYCQA